MKQLLCFDLDNTLVSSDKAHTKAYSDAMNDYGFKIKLKHPEKHYGEPHHSVTKYLLGKHSSKENVEKVALKHDEYIITRYAYLAEPKPYVMKLLPVLAEKYTLAILSNSSKDNVISLLNGADIPKHYFSIIVGGDMVKHSKPSAEEIHKAEHITKHKAVVMIGDSIYDLRAARRAKIPGIGVLTGMYPKRALLQEKPYAIIENMSKLPQLLNKLHQAKQS